MRRSRNQMQIRIIKAFSLLIIAIIYLSSAMSVTLVIANKRYSSWSMRPWLALRYAVGLEKFFAL